MVSKIDKREEDFLGYVDDLVWWMDRSDKYRWDDSTVALNHLPGWF